MGHLLHGRSNELKDRFARGAQGMRSLADAVAELQRKGLVAGK